MIDVLLWGAWRAVGSVAAAGGRVLAPWRRGASRLDLQQRLALPPTLAGLPSEILWLHAASVGEVRAMAPLSRTLRARLGQPATLLTTSTMTGRALAERELGLMARLAPLDGPGPVQRFLAATRPRLHLIVETELWPLRLSQLAARGVPVALVSARLSEKRWPTYQRLAGLYARALDAVTLVCPASSEDAERFAALGVPASRFGPLGSLKWDAALDPPQAGEVASLAAQWGVDRSRPWLALGSVHPGEGHALLTALAGGSVGAALPCGVLLAPRHLDRYASELERLERSGWRVHRLSKGAAPAGTDIIVLDGLGLLPRVYPLAAVAMMGGTFVEIGGHSPLEAAVAGCPLIAGPYRDKQSDLCAPLAAAGALLPVATITEAATQVLAWLRDDTARRRAGDAGRGVVVQHRGVSDRLSAAVAELWR